MNAPRWNLLSLVTLAAAVATPASGQTVAPAVRPDSGTQSGATIPDFSGIWGHPYIPGPEPPLSGPGPVVNKSRVRQLFGPDGPLAPGSNLLVTNLGQVVGDYTNPILKPPAAEAVKKFGEVELSGVTSPTPNNQCWPQPVPYILWHLGIQLLQQPHQITILYHFDHEVRHVRMNRSHPANMTPSWYGDSVGYYEGDTLVVDTIGIKADRPFAMVDWYGTPYTGALHVVERYRLVEYEAAREAQERSGHENFRLPGDAWGWAPAPNYKGQGLQLHFTVEDGGVFTVPWSATVTYRRPLATEWPEWVCAENTYGFYGPAVPRADKPDF
jgi:hypothetical protein